MRTLGLLLFVIALSSNTLAADLPGHRLAAIARGETRLQQDQPAARFRLDGDRIERIYGAPLAFGPTARDAAEGFVATYLEDLYGVPPAEVGITYQQDVMVGKFTAVYFTQQHGGLPVHGTGLTILVRHDIGDGVVLVSGNLEPLTTVELPPVVLTADGAVAAAAAAHTGFAFDAPQLVIFVGDANGDGVREALPAYRFSGGNNQLVDPERYEFVIDASDKSGRIVSQESQIYFEDIAGTVQGNGSPGWRPDIASNPPALMGLPLLRVNVTDGANGETDQNGAFTLTNAGTDPVQVTTGLGGSGETAAGRWTRVTNQATGGTISATQSVTPPGPANFLLNPTPSEVLTAQINAFIHTTRVHDFAAAINPNHPGLHVQMPTNVNLNSSCNAFYDGPSGGSINFYRAGGGCPNMAYSSVVYHEYGHHLVWRPYALAGHQQPASSYHEGNADTASYLLMDDPCMGYGFFGGSACLRNGENSLAFPCCCGHDCAGVISGSFWDTRQALGLTVPAEALSIIRALWLNSILVLPANLSPAITIDVLTLDDTDGNIANGTPHYFEIAEGFGAHNLDAPPLTPFELSLPNGAATLIDPPGGTRMRVLATQVASQADPAAAFLYFAEGAAAFTAIPLQQISASEFDAVFPAAACTSDVRFYISIGSVGGPTLKLPANAPVTWYDALSAFWEAQPFADNFETDQGWTSIDGDDLISGTWERGTPRGNPVSGVPPEDYDESGMAYVTSALNGTNVDGGPAILISPPWTVEGDTPVLRYALWFSNSTGPNPGQDVLDVLLSNDDGATWTPLESYGPTGPGSSGGWNLREIRLADELALGGLPIRLRLDVSDTGGNSIVEGALDAVRLRDHRCAPNNAPGDTNCDGAVNFLDIDPFIMALFDPPAYAAAFPACRLSTADTNLDGAVNFLDIDGFLALLFP